MASMHCNSCNKTVTPPSRGFIFFLFWPWTILFMKKNAQVVMEPTWGRMKV